MWGVQVDCVGDPRFTTVAYNFGCTVSMPCQGSRYYCFGGSTGYDECSTLMAVSLDNPLEPVIDMNLHQSSAHDPSNLNATAGDDVKPCTRMIHSTDSSLRALMVFGGSNSQREFFNDLWLYNLDSRQWAQHNCGSDDGPSPRNGTTLTTLHALKRRQLVMEQRAVLFGGGILGRRVEETEYFNDCFELCLQHPMQASLRAQIVAILLVAQVESLEATTLPVDLWGQVIDDLAAIAHSVFQTL